MRIIRFGWLVPLSAVCIVACSASSNSGASDDGDASGNTHQDGGAAGGNKSDASAGHDAAASIDAGNPDAGVVSLPPFAFVLGGQTRTLTKMNLRMGSSDCAKEISMNANLAPMGDEENDPNDLPQLQLSVCVSDLPSSGDAQYGITSGDPTVAQLQFQFLTTDTSHFPIADGPGIQVIQDGTKGTFAMTASGTFDLGDGTGGTPLRCSYSSR